MTQEYLIGEMSVRLEQLQRCIGPGARRNLARLRYRVETEPLSLLAGKMPYALALADAACWSSLSAGDVAAFARQAELSAELREFGVCAHLLPDG
ncbi:MAG TPA: hypothetical protein VFE59_16730 [Trebonia sp.]|jgi:hypothetical protein|nr:hypothetical protein [Trebonia sp.]